MYEKYTIYTGWIIIASGHIFGCFIVVNKVFGLIWLLHELIPKDQGDDTLVKFVKHISQMLYPSFMDVFAARLELF